MRLQNDQNELLKRVPFLCIYLSFLRPVSIVLLHPFHLHLCLLAPVKHIRGAKVLTGWIVQGISAFSISTRRCDASSIIYPNLLYSSASSGVGIFISTSIQSGAVYSRYPNQPTRKGIAHITCPLLWHYISIPTLFLLLLVIALEISV